MKDEEFQEAMHTWAESEVASAPDLRPTAEMVGLVRAKQEPRRVLSVSSRWALAGAAAASLVLIAALFALIFRSGVIPGTLPTSEEALIAQREGPEPVQTVIAAGGGKGQGGKGPDRGQAAFLHLVFEIQQQDAPIVQSIDLLNPPEQSPVLTPADNYRLVLEPVEERYVHVYQVTSSGSLVQLFPNPAYSAVPNPLLPGQLTMLPAEPNWLYLDGSPGEERLYVVASSQPLQDLDALYAQYTQEPDAASKRALLSDLLDTVETIAETHPEQAVALKFVFQHR
jgi:hypothetical protein